MAVTVDDLIRFVDRWQRRRVVVVGDFMLDRYAFGNAERLSPDAPVPVLAIEREEQRPGGAANVCCDLRALRCDVAAVGVIGDDETGKTLLSALQQEGCDTAGFVVAPDRPTTVKHNFVGLAQHRHPQKMFRVDSENKRPVSDDVADQLAQRVEKLLEGADALCIEDYHKGVCSERLCQRVIALARERGVPVFVDPAAIEDFSKYRGATTITPNRTEASRAVGQPVDDDLDTVTRVARQLRDALALETIVLTLDKQGALLLEDDKPQLLPTRARSVYDVTGAGDMVLATLAAARANGAAWDQAVALANVAAGLEVERFGVVAIELDEILLALLTEKHANLGKLRTLDQLLPELAAFRKQGRKVAFTNGCFDILHAGHVSFLRQARAEGDLLVVGLNSDDSIRRLKGPERPVNHQDDRVMVMSELQSVDYVVLFDADTPVELIEAIKPAVLIKGADYTRDTVVGADIVEKHGGRVALIDLVHGRSTTNIIARIRD